MSYNTTSAKEFNSKKGKVNDSWKNWIRVDATITGSATAEDKHTTLPHAYVEFTDSMIKETIMAERKVDIRDIRHKVALIFKRPWTGFCDNKTENTSNYCSYVKKAYWEGRIDQFFIAELIPGKEPIIHDISIEKSQEMQAKSTEFKQRQEAEKAAYDAMMALK